MKNKALILLFSLSLIFWMACNENEPIIPCLSCDATEEPIEPTDKKVLIEEFTGVRCVNCPAGSAEVEDLLENFGNRLIAVSIHAGFFSTPYAESNEDYTIPEGTSLLGYLDQPTGYPTAVINRKIFENEMDLQVNQTSWGGYIQQEATQLSPLVFNLELEYNASTRELTAKNNIQVAEGITESVRYSVMVTETDITDVQLKPDPEGKVSDYVHKHVLRDMMTPFNGEEITEPLVTNTSFEKTHSMVLPASWNADKISVIVLASYDGTNREVIQVEEKKLTN